mmetsp:Transcript_22427/g.47007  ORF Transcript_22427/g.47007 Transcript_22427/m.47007 type:complete len:257 (-) Transcript_22427:564-1334(-)
MIESRKTSRLVVDGVPFGASSTVLPAPGSVGEDELVSINGVEARASPFLEPIWPFPLLALESEDSVATEEAEAAAATEEDAPSLTLSAMSPSPSPSPSSSPPSVEETDDVAVTTKPFFFLRFFFFFFLAFETSFVVLLPFSPAVIPPRFWSLARSRSEMRRWRIIFPSNGCCFDCSGSFIPGLLESLLTFLPSSFDFRFPLDFPFSCPLFFSVAPFPLASLFSVSIPSALDVLALTACKLGKISPTIPLTKTLQGV